MTKLEAKEIADLLNDRNRLDVEYDAEKVLNHAGDYLFESHNDAVVACVEVKKVQWYQWEICHLSVSENFVRQGRGKRLICRAEEKAKSGRARIVQCTIRVGNEASEQTFRRNGYHEACCFFNARTSNYVAVWQKVLSTPESQSI
jgi:N-acetylglutamate synthase-like GNAT family acetyltransferase